MKVILYSVRDYERAELVRANKGVHTLIMTDKSLDEETVLQAEGCDAVVVSAIDNVSSHILDRLKLYNIRYLSTRSVAHDHIDAGYAAKIGILTGYTPHSCTQTIAEYTLGLMLMLNRKLAEGRERVKSHNFSTDGLTGSNLSSHTVGIIGTGNVGKAVINILSGFCCRILAYDSSPAPVLRSRNNVRYVSLEELLGRSDIVSLHIPLNDSTRGLICKENIALMKPGSFLINTSRCGVMNLKDVFDAIKENRISCLGMDIYENENELLKKTADTEKAGLLSEMIAHPHIFVSSHQAFLSTDTLRDVADVTFYNLNSWASGFRSKNEIN